MTPVQLEASAKAPWTRTMVGFVSAAKAGTLASEVASNADASNFLNMGFPRSIFDGSRKHQVHDWLLYIRLKSGENRRSAFMLSNP
jgi:hypothetical protein